MRNSPHLQLSPVLIWGSADLFQSSSQFLSLVRRSYNNFTPVEACSGCMSSVQFMFNFTATGHITADAFMTGSRFPLGSAETPDNCLPLDSCWLCLAYLTCRSHVQLQKFVLCARIVHCAPFCTIQVINSASCLWGASMDGMVENTALSLVFLDLLEWWGSWMSCVVFGYQAGMIMVLLPVY